MSQLSALQLDGLGDAGSFRFLVAKFFWSASS